LKVFFSQIAIENNSHPEKPFEKTGGNYGVFRGVIWSSPSRGCAGAREGERTARLHGRNCFIALEQAKFKAGDGWFPDLEHVVSFRFETF